LAGESVTILISKVGSLFSIPIRFSDRLLVPDGIKDEVKGAKSVKAILGNLSTIVQGLAELRNLYGTGHGKEGSTKGLAARHAKLAVGAAITLADFLFDTHENRKGNP
jgi:hypothetical protein